MQSLSGIVRLLSFLKLVVNFLACLNFLAQDALLVRQVESKHLDANLGLSDRQVAGQRP